MKKFVFIPIILVLVGVLAYSGVQIWNIHSMNMEELRMREYILQYRPPYSPPLSAADARNAPPTIINQAIADLQTQNEDTVGWIYIPQTLINYPIMWRPRYDGQTVYFYINHNFNRERVFAGSIFLDGRNNPQFSHLQNIIYGHSMQNGSMFGQLNWFATRGLWDTVPYGTLYLLNATYTLQIFAYADVWDDDALYNVITEGDELQRADELEGGSLISHIRERSRLFRDVGFEEGDKILALSTCGNRFHNDRIVLFARMVRHGG